MEKFILALTNKKAVLSADSPLGWQTGSYAPGVAVRARKCIAMGIIMEKGKEVVFIGLSLLCTAPRCKIEFQSSDINSDQAMNIALQKPPPRTAA